MAHQSSHPAINQDSSFPLVMVILLILFVILHNVPGRNVYKRHILVTFFSLDSGHTPELEWWIALVLMQVIYATSYR